MNVHIYIVSILSLLILIFLVLLIANNINKEKYSNCDTDDPNYPYSSIYYTYPKSN